MFLKASRSGALSLSNIPARAWCGVGTGAGNVVDVTRGFVFLKLVFWTDQSFSK